MIDREFYIQYISDEWKSVYGSRPDFLIIKNMSDEELIKTANHLESEIMEIINEKK
tara:strand:- start:1514 stop:1681 length:168 start_codon:yes stop_codon:yes gene_type:complete